MKHLFALFIAIYLPITANLVQPTIACATNDIANGAYTEVCSGRNADGSTWECTAEYINWQPVSEVCE